MLSRQDVADAIIAEFPQIRAQVEQDRDLIHVQFAWLKMYVLEPGAKEDDIAAIKKCIALLDRFVRDGDEDVVTAVYVAFLEHIDVDTIAGEKIFALLTPRLRSGYEEMAEYARSVEGRKNSDLTGN